jgi:hypothetical protein
MAQPTGFLGMVNVNDALATNERDFTWIKGIFHRYLRGGMGKARLAPLLAMAPKEKTSNEFHYFTKDHPDQIATFLAGSVYTTASLGTAYTSGGVSGTILYVKMSLAHSTHFRAGHVVLFRKIYSSTGPVIPDAGLDTHAYVLDVVRNGASSYVVVKLLEADDNGTANDLSDANQLEVIGNANPWGGRTPMALSYIPTERSNLCQLFRTALNIPNSLREEPDFRTGNKYLELKREAQELHFVEMEKNFWWGSYKKDADAAGNEWYYTRGLIQEIRERNPELIVDYRTATAYSGKTWAQSGKDFLDAMNRLAFKKGDTEKLVFAGDGALEGVNRLAEQYGNINISPGATEFGLAIRTWLTPFGSYKIMDCPLFTQNDALANTLVILEPRQIGYCYNRNTQFLPDRQENGQDARVDEFLTECGLKYYFTDGSAVLYGVGNDNLL